MSTRALIGRSPIAFRRRCSHSGLGPFLTPLITRPANTGQALAVSLSKSSLIGIGLGKVPFTGLSGSGLSLPRPAAARSRATPRTPRQSGRFGVMAISITASSSPRAFAAAAADLCVGGKLDDAGMLVGKLKLSLRQKHAVRLNAPDLGLGEREIDARHIASDRREHAFEARASVRRAANDLQALGAGIDLADLQLVGVRMLLGFEHLRHLERRKRGRRIEHLLDLEPDAGERVGDLGHARACVEMVLEP